MKKETFEKGKKIQAEIEELRKHFDEIFTNSSAYDSKCKYNPYGFEYSKTGSPRMVPRFHVNQFHTDNTKSLRNEFVPFPVDDFMAIYKIKVENKIASLKEEFENLKD